MGYWFRGQHELLLVGVKGKVSPPIPTERVSSVYREKRTEHSKKPAYFRGVITDSFPAEWNRLELFARNDGNKDLFNKNELDGWDVWGNEVKSDIKLLNE